MKLVKYLALHLLISFKYNRKQNCNYFYATLTSANATSFPAASNIFFCFQSYHLMGIAFLNSVSMFRIPTRFHTPFNLPPTELFKARRLMAKPLSRYSMWCQ